MAKNSFQADVTFSRNSLWTRWWWWWWMLFFWYGWPKKGVKLYFQLTNIRDSKHTRNRIWPCPEPGLRLCWMTLYGSDNHHNKGRELFEIFIWNICFKYFLCQIKHFLVLMMMQALHISLMENDSVLLIQIYCY